MYMESEKIGINNLINKAEIDTESQCRDTNGARAGGVNWEIGIDIYALLILSI